MTRHLIYIGAMLLGLSIPLLMHGFVTYAPVARTSFLFRYQVTLFYIGLSMAVISALMCVPASISRHRITSISDHTVILGYSSALASLIITVLITLLIVS